MDFSSSIRLSCLGDDDNLSFEKFYITVTVLTVLVYLFSVLIMPRILFVKKTLLQQWRKKGSEPKKMVFAKLLYNQFTYRVSLTLVLLHAVSCRIALKELYCDGVAGDRWDDIDNPDLSDCR